VVDKQVLIEKLKKIAKEKELLQKQIIKAQKKEDKEIEQLLKK